MRTQQNLAFGFLLWKTLRGQDDDLELKLERREIEGKSELYIAVIDNLCGHTQRAPIDLFKKAIIIEVLQRVHRIDVVKPPKWRPQREIAPASPEEKDRLARFAQVLAQQARVVLDESGAALPPRYTRQPAAAAI